MMEINDAFNCARNVKRTLLSSKMPSSGFSLSTHLSTQQIVIGCFGQLNVIRAP